MKSKFLLPLLLVPLMFFSCNKNSKGYIDPFPDDDYVSIGFDHFAEDEVISRTILSSQEISRLRSTIDNIQEVNTNIYEHQIHSHVRDYTRAFANEFKQGYSVSNFRSDSSIVSYRNIKDGKPRTITDTNSQEIYDYAYGKNYIDKENKEYIYFAKATSNKYNEIAKANATDVLKVIEEDNYTYATSIANSSTWTDDIISQIFSENISQAGFDINPDNNSCGADNNGKLILTLQIRKDYQASPEAEKGIYETKDGRKYLAKENMVQVIQLVSKGSWYLINKVRMYNEIAITSDAIEPNVPITMRNQKVIIHYEETIHNFYTETTESRNPIIPSDVELEDTNE